MSWPCGSPHEAKTFRHGQLHKGLRMQRKRRLHCCNAVPTLDLDVLKEALVQDSQNLFSQKGMDTSVYDGKVRFRDPITKYDDIQVRFIRRFERNLGSKMM